MVEISFLSFISIVVFFFAGFVAGWMWKIIKDSNDGKD